MDTEEKDHKQQDSESLDETDAKLFTSKLFGGDKNESRQDVRAENPEELADKLETVEIKEEKALDILVTDKDEYPSDNVRRGVCLILENDMFHTNLGLSKRKGSSVDRQVMADTFTRLQFEVRIYSNLSVKEINNTLEKTALEDHNNRDMLAGNKCIINARRLNVSSRCQSWCCLTGTKGSFMATITPIPLTRSGNPSQRTSG